MARGNRTAIETCHNKGTIRCNYCEKQFSGKFDFIKRMCKKHLILSHSFTEQQSNEELQNYEESNYVSLSRRNYQNQVDTMNLVSSSYLFDLEMKMLMN